MTPTAPRTLAALSPFDWVLIAFLVASTVRAFLRGFLLEILSITGLIAGTLLASWYYADLAPRIVAWLSPLTSLALVTADIIAFLAILSLVMAAASLAGRFLRSGASAIGLGLVDRFVGAAFGLVRGCLLGVACMVVVTAFAPTLGVVHNSLLLPYFLAGARGVSFVVPGAMQQQLADGANRIKHNKLVWIKPPQ